MKNDEDEYALPPFTLEEAKNWLHTLEDIATITRDHAYATELVLLHLLKTLNANGMVDGQLFIAEVMAGISRIEGANYQLALKVLMADLQKAVQPVDSEQPRH